MESVKRGRSKDVYFCPCVKGQSRPVDEGCVRCSPTGTAPYTSCLCRRTCDALRTGKVPAVLLQKVLVSTARPPCPLGPRPCLHCVLLYVPLCWPCLTSSSLSPKSAGLSAEQSVCWCYISPLKWQ